MRAGIRFPPSPISFHIYRVWIRPLSTQKDGEKRGGEREGLLSPPEKGRGGRKEKEKRREGGEGGTQSH